MQIKKGLLGWSNKRNGLEFYRYDEKIIPRHSTEWGDLLAHEIPNDNEGCPIIVLIMDRKATPKEVQEMLDGISSQVLSYD